MSKVLSKGGSAGVIRRRLNGRCVPLLYLLLGALPVAHSVRYAHADSIVSNREVAQLVRLEDVDELDGEIFGYVVNHSDRYVYRVTLLIRYHWHWHNEFKPGEDDPSRHDELTLTEMIPPEGRIRFSYRSTEPLQERTDGELLPTVSISSVQAYEKRTGTAVPQVKPLRQPAEEPHAARAPGQTPAEQPPAAAAAPLPESTPPSQVVPAGAGTAPQP